MGELESLGKVAGIGGIALGALVLMFRRSLAVTEGVNAKDRYRLVRLALVLSWSIGVLGIVAWAWGASSAKSAPARLSSLQGETGWVFAGYADRESGQWREGPYITFADGTVNANDIKKGSIAFVGSPRRVVILDYKQRGIERNLESPTRAAGGIITGNDETSITLGHGSPLVVRDIAIAGYRGNPQSAVWLRVIDKP